MTARGQSNYFLLTGKLFHEYVCINYNKTDQKDLTILKWTRKIESWCLSELAQNYQNLLAHDVSKDQIGNQIILPAIHLGSPRDVYARFQDAMAIVSKYGRGKIDWFVMMKSNPN